MIKTKFSELKVGDEFYNLPDTGAIRTCKKTGSHAYDSPSHEHGITDVTMEVWIKKFKDRYGKDLSIGDRVSVQYCVERDEFDLFDGEIELMGNLKVMLILLLNLKILNMKIQ